MSGRPGQVRAGRAEEQELVDQSSSDRVPRKLWLVCRWPQAEALTGSRQHQVWTVLNSLALQWTEQMWAFARQLAA